MSNDAHVHALLPGYRLHEYRIERVLGHGGFGITYLALDENLATKVAIKEYLPDEFAVRDSRSTVLPKTAGGQQEFQWGLTRFLEEAQTLARFRHPNIVQVLRLFRANGTAYIVMPYERGRSLADYLHALGRTLNETELLNLAAPLLDGLEAVHREGFLHRDIKPGNVFIRSTAVPILLDFGSARQQTGTKSRSLTAILTPGYAPIEQYGTAAAQGPWTDIYGFAGVLYRCATGKAPVSAPERSQALLASEPDPLHPAAEVGVGRFMPETLDAIDQGLRVTAKDRPQSVGDWRNRLLAAHRRSGRRPVPGQTLGTAVGLTPPSGDRPSGVSSWEPSRLPSTPASQSPPSHLSGRVPESDSIRRRPVDVAASARQPGDPRSQPSSGAPALSPSVRQPPSAQRPENAPPTRRTGVYIAGGLVSLVIVAVGIWLTMGSADRPDEALFEEIVEATPRSPAQAPSDPQPTMTDPAETVPETLPDSDATGPDQPATGPRIEEPLVRLITSAPAGVSAVALPVPVGSDWPGAREVFVVAALPENGTLRWQGRQLATSSSLPGSALGNLTFSSPVGAVGSSGRLVLQRGGAIRVTLDVRIVAERCDRLAADPDDPLAPPPGVALDDIAAAEAVAACRAAIERFPDTDRFSYQLGRALAAADRREEALDLLRQAADLGHEAAIEQLERIEISPSSDDDLPSPGTGYTLPPDQLRELAADGDPDAQRELARRYLDGDGLGRDPRYAALWLRRAAEQGDALAQRNLGILYRDGRGVPQNLTEAAQWFRLAADQGDAWSQTELGIMYADGEGVRRDSWEARRLFEAAADQGYAWGMLHLGRLYRDGEGVAVNPVRAAQLFAAAAARDRDGAVQAYGDAVAELRSLPQRTLAAAAQRWLTALGYATGREDGVVDLSTSTAIRRFQERARMTATGNVSVELLIALADAQ